jgi:hypothetical protein
VPLLGIAGGPAHVVPVDFVARAIDHIAQQDGLDGKVFHLVDPANTSQGAMLNAFAKAAYAPEFSMRLEGANVAKMIPKPLRTGFTGLAGSHRLSAQAS